MVNRPPVGPWPIGNRLDLFALVGQPRRPARTPVVWTDGDGVPWDGVAGRGDVALGF